MGRIGSVLKLALAVAVSGLLIGVAFGFGYRAGSAEQDHSVDHRSEQVNTSQVIPTATAVPPESAVSATTTPSPSSPVLSPQDTPTRKDDAPHPTSVVAPTATKTEPTQEPFPSDEEALGVFDEVWALIEDEFFGELPSSDERAYGAIRGMLGTLDDAYTSFTEPAIAEIRREDASSNYEGIGAFVRINDDNILEIVGVFTDSPAEEAGLRAGDRVLEVDSKSIVGYGIYEAITLIRGPEGTAVILTIQRDDGEPFQVSIVRARLEIPILESEILEGGIGYVTLFDFSSEATARLEQAIEDLVDQGITALIFDLRGNPGGFLDQAVQVADVFLDEGLVLIERRSDGEEIEYESSDKGLAQDVPLVVLVNGGSASASEIVAGAIQDRARGILIGETTFGKGSVQLLHTLSDGSELRVTVARWFTPNDHAIHGEGLSPDIEVPLTPEDVEADRDPQLDRAIEHLRSGQ